MKKIFLTISRGSLARNLLQNDFYKIVREKYKIVLVTPAAHDSRFTSEFSHPNVSFVSFVELEHSPLDRFFFFFYKNLIYNNTIDQKNHWGVIGSTSEDRPSIYLYYLKKFVFGGLSKLSFLRTLLRFLDNAFLQKKEVNFFSELVRLHKPDLVIVSNISSDSETALVKAARKNRIPTVGMTKSWDNLSKHGFRAKVDLLAVWSKFMKDEALIFQDYKESEVVVTGIPQFDIYADKKRIWSREKFCSLYGLDPQRKIIFFGSEGKKFPTDGDIAEIIHGDIIHNKFIDPSQLLVRPHYGYKKDEQKFKSLFGKKHASIDLFNNPSLVFRDEWDYSQDFIDRFANCLFHADITINTCSTLSLDAVAFDKPIINIAFDGHFKQPYEHSLVRWYETDYYRHLLKTKAVTLVYSKEELKDKINEYLKNPSIKAEDRVRLREEFCGSLDGKVGEFFASMVHRLLNKSGEKV